MHRDFMDLAISNALTRAGRGEDARHRGRPRQDRHRHLRRRRDRRPPVQVGVLLPDHPAASAATRSSCSPPAATSRRWSTRPATRRRASRPRRATRPTPQDWLEQASKVKGSWWDDYVEWLAERTRTGAQQADAGSAPRRTSRSATLLAPMSMTAEPTRTGGGDRDRVRTVAVRGLQAQGLGAPGARPAGRRAPAAAVQRHRRQPRGAAAARRRPRPRPGRRAVRRTRRRRQPAAAVPLPDRGAVLLGRGPDGHGSATASSTCSGCPGAAGWPNSSPSSPAGGYAGVVLVATGTGALMVPGAPAGAREDAHPATPPRPGVRRPHRPRDLRRQHAHRPRGRRRPAARAPPGPDRSAATTTSSPR